jgi:hypothetical protein
MTQRCFYCSNPATLLCDFKLGWAIGELVRDRSGAPWNAIDGSKPPHTCDMPLCRDHAEYRGWLHIKAGRNSHFDSYDYCPEHQGMVDTGAPVIQESEADRLRRAVHADARRRLMRERGALQSPSSAAQGELF